MTMSMGGVLCGAKTRSGMPCHNVPMANGRCRMHGGKSLKGAAHPNFKHGRYAQQTTAYERLLVRMHRRAKRAG